MDCHIFLHDAEVTHRSSHCLLTDCNLGMSQQSASEISSCEPTDLTPAVPARAETAAHALA